MNPLGKKKYLLKFVSEGKKTLDQQGGETWGIARGFELQPWRQTSNEGLCKPTGTVLLQGQKCQPQLWSRERQQWESRAGRAPWAGFGWNPGNWGGVELFSALSSSPSARPCLLHVQGPSAPPAGKGMDIAHTKLHKIPLKPCADRADTINIHSIHEGTDLWTAFFAKLYILSTKPRYFQHHFWIFVCPELGAGFVRPVLLMGLFTIQLSNFFWNRNCSHKYQGYFLGSNFTVPAASSSHKYLDHFFVSNFTMSAGSCSHKYQDHFLVPYFMLPAGIGNCSHRYPSNFLVSNFTVPAGKGSSDLNIWIIF